MWERRRKKLRQHEEKGESNLFSRWGKSGAHWCAFIVGSNENNNWIMVETWKWGNEMKASDDEFGGKGKKGQKRERKREKRTYFDIKLEIAVWVRMKGQRWAVSLRRQWLYLLIAVYTGRGYIQIYTIIIFYSTSTLLYGIYHTLRICYSFIMLVVKYVEINNFQF